MKDTRDINYYKIKAKELTKKRFDEILFTAKLHNAEPGTQLTYVASFLQHEARTKIQLKAKNFNFVPPTQVRDYLFNDINFALWCMPQENPIPVDIYKKMMKLKSLQYNGLPVKPTDELTGEEKIRLVDSLSWKRGTEKFGVEITGSLRSGIPFGQDRLMLIWAISQALKAGEPNVIGFFVKEFLDYFKIHAIGRAYDEVQERCDRLQEANIRVWWTANEKKYELKCNYFDSALIVRPKKTSSKEQDAINVITLHLSLWAHLAKENYVWLHPDVIRELKDSPGALDLYQWACVYAFKGKMKSVPITDLFMQLGMKEDQPFKNKKTSLKRWIAQVNSAVSKDNLQGAGTNFTLTLQEEKMKHQLDSLILHPASKKLLSETAINT
ncbi:MAG: replication initiator protein A [Thaumarchaeota archaeon]|nr:replication initiator protein A [Nitrososphaerota archaeon]